MWSTQHFLAGKRAVVPSAELERAKALSFLFHRFKFTLKRVLDMQQSREED